MQGFVIFTEYLYYMNILLQLEINNTNLFPTSHHIVTDVNFGIYQGIWN